MAHRLFRWANVGARRCLLEDCFLCCCFLVPCEWCFAVISLDGGVTGRYSYTVLYCIIVMGVVAEYFIIEIFLLHALKYLVLFSSIRFGNFLEMDTQSNMVSCIHLSEFLFVSFFKIIFIWSD